MAANVIDHVPNIQIGVDAVPQFGLVPVGEEAQFALPLTGKEEASWEDVIHDFDLVRSVHPTGIHLHGRDYELRSEEHEGYSVRSLVSEDNKHDVALQSGLILARAVCLITPDQPSRFRHLGEAHTKRKVMVIGNDGRRTQEMRVGSVLPLHVNGRQLLQNIVHYAHHFNLRKSVA